jgi:hypothetical protein
LSFPEIRTSKQELLVIDGLSLSELRQVSLRLLEKYLDILESHNEHNIGCMNEKLYLKEGKDLKILNN